jgi:PEGA domain-containing protein
VTPDTANVKAVSPFKAKQGPAPAVPSREDATLEFASESKAADVAAGLPLTIKIKNPWALVVAVAFGVLLLAGVVAGLTLRTPTAPVTGSLSVESDPPGAEVRIDNALRGTTPLTLSLAEGRYAVAVQRGSNTRQMNVEIAANTARSYHIEWAPDAAPVAIQTGNLSVVSDPPGAAVTVDGSSRGLTPLTIRELGTGRHEVLVKNANTTYQRSVQVEAGATASLVVGGSPTATPSWGWITLRMPFPVQVLEAGRIVGTSEIDRITSSTSSQIHSASGRVRR